MVKHYYRGQQGGFLCEFYGREFALHDPAPSNHHCILGHVKAQRFVLDRKAAKEYASIKVHVQLWRSFSCRVKAMAYSR
jgi:hypothetical protein